LQRAMFLRLLPLVASAAAFSPTAVSRVHRPQPVYSCKLPCLVSMVVSMEPVMSTPAGLLIADQDVLSQLESFQQSHAFLISIVLAIVTRLIILEIRRQGECRRCHASCVHVCLD
jgi:hypothetical protein